VTDTATNPIDALMEVLTQMSRQQDQQLTEMFKDPAERTRVLDALREQVVVLDGFDTSINGETPEPEYRTYVAEHHGNLYGGIQVLAAIVAALQEQVSRLETALVELNTEDAA
jgi:hypothetical protein